MKNSKIERNIPRQYSYWIDPDGRHGRGGVIMVSGDETQRLIDAKKGLDTVCACGNMRT